MTVACGADLHVWQLNDAKRLGSVHVLCPGDVDVSELLASAKHVMHAAGVHSTTIQPELMDAVAHRELGTKWCSEPICDDAAACKEGACCPPADVLVHPAAVTGTVVGV